MPTIYVLLCKGKRYYIGKTDRPVKSRVAEHFSNNGSEWTKKYKPTKVIEVIEGAGDLDEDKYTKIYMIKHGIDRVRGGSYSMILLPEYKLKALQDEICTANNLCFRCMMPGHFSSKRAVQKFTFHHNNEKTFILF
jgi:predicted GIY-YIG superfamily endonuclease